jgi:hypothetical protein
VDEPAASFDFHCRLPQVSRRAPFDGRVLLPTAIIDEVRGRNCVGWAIELRNIDDAAIRADLCGVGVAEVRSDVQAVMLAVPLSEAAV